MTTHHGFNDTYDKYDIYAEQYADMYDPHEHDRQARRKRKRVPNHEPKKPEEQILDELTDKLVELEGGFETTYTPSLYEGEWLLSSLRTFYEQALITDVLSIVKGGKEASVYRCAAHPSTGRAQIAAKVYRPSKFRSLSNDAVYRQGRDVLDADGHDIHGGLYRERVARAINKKTAFGRQARHTSWLMHEFTTLETLHSAGADVPEPIASGENAILMTWLGEREGAIPAPTLHEVTLEADEAERLFADVLRNIDLMLSLGVVHGDLSAFNILVWEGQMTIIDFPQVVDAHNNPDARWIFERDVTRICEYFARQGVARDAERITQELWAEHILQQYIPIIPVETPEDHTPSA